MRLLFMRWLSLLLSFILNWRIFIGCKIMLMVSAAPLQASEAANDSVIENPVTENQGVHSNESIQPQRVVSVNLCTDQLLVYLAERWQIASVSFLAASKLYSYVWDRIEGIPVNNGLIEQIAPLKPDLVLAGRYTSATTINFLHRFGLNVHQIDIPQNIDDVKQTIQQVAELLGAQEKGSLLIAQLERKLQQAATASLHRGEKAAVIIAPNNFTPGTYTFKGQLVELAGFRNVASDYGIDWYGNIKLEQIVASQPDVLILDGVTDENEGSLAEKLLQHPALRRGLPHTQVIYMPGNYWNCGGPTIVNAIDKLVNS